MTDIILETDGLTKGMIVSTAGANCPCRYEKIPT
jgi:hypothetical protein